jgi:hypothetical protein
VPEGIGRLFAIAAEWLSPKQEAHAVVQPDLARLAQAVKSGREP